MATEYAARWPFYNEPTRMKLGWEKARADIQPILRAINEAGLDLVDAPAAGNDPAIPDSSARASREWTP